MSRKKSKNYNSIHRNGNSGGMSSDIQGVIALDVMGADTPLSEIVRGGVAAARDLGDDFHLVLVGKSQEIHAELDRISKLPHNVVVKNSDVVVPMGLPATEALRLKDSSISVGLQMVKDNKADAFVSPGNTGAVMASSLVILGRIEGILRPAIAGAFPTATDKPTLVLDVGANADCKPGYLSQFAVMGSIFYSVAFGAKSPRVGLLSIGEERSKGNELAKAARDRLAESNIRFVGNIEGRDVLSGEVDVVVTDGFTGNILLKFFESLQPMMVNAVIRQIRANIFSRFGLWLMFPFMNRMRDRFDYARSGGAPLLGVDGNVVICHGKSNEKAITNAVKQAHNMITGQMQEQIRQHLLTNHFGQRDATEG